MIYYRTKQIIQAMQTILMIIFFRFQIKMHSIQKKKIFFITLN